MIESSFVYRVNINLMQSPAMGNCLPALFPRIYSSTGQSSENVSVGEMQPSRIHVSFPFTIKILAVLNVLSPHYSMLKIVLLKTVFNYLFHIISLKDAHLFKSSWWLEEVESFSSSASF